MRALAVLPLFFFPLVALADCTEQLQTWAKTLRPDLKLDSEHAVCRINPANSSQVLAALPFAENVDEDGQGEYGLAVVVANASSGKIVAHHYQAASISSDAVYFESLSLDTARYQLAPQIRAFGVRVAYQGSSRVNPFSSTTLNLYVLDGPALRPVMNTLEVSRSNGEWDGSCTGDFIQTLRTVSIGDTSKNGLARMYVNQKTINTQNHTRGEDCENVVGKPTVAKFTLEYDGNQYSVPGELSFP
ncbi:UNVERIFIED_ORG: hypothetical protein J2Y77_001893 [Pseudomonas lini]